MGSLFRPEALEGQRQAWLGGIRLIRPLSLTLLTVFMAATAALVLAYLFVGEYTRKAHLSGALVPDVETDRLHAELYATASAIGLLSPQQRVLLRYPALQKQTLGHPEGRVLQVSRTPVQGGGPAALSQSPAIDGAGALSGPNAGEARYRVIVALDTPTLPAGGPMQPLAAGMQVEAEVLLERRRLIDWLFQPLRDSAQRD